MISSLTLKFYSTTFVSTPFAPLATLSSEFPVSPMAYFLCQKAHTHTHTHTRTGAALSNKIDTAPPPYQFVLKQPHTRLHVAVIEPTQKFQAVGTPNEQFAAFGHSKFRKREAPWVPTPRFLHLGGDRFPLPSVPAVPRPLEPQSLSL